MEDQGRGPDPSILKFTGIKVHVSQLSKRHNSKAVVISNGTSAHDVIKMVAKKLHMDQKQTNKMCLVVELHTPDPQYGREMYQEMVLRDDETPLSLYENYPRGAVRFSLVWRENYVCVEQQAPHHQQPEVDNQVSRERHDGVPSPNRDARQTMERLYHKLAKYNGCTLPGGGPGKDSGGAHHKSAGSSNAHQGREEFLIHYEPYAVDGNQSNYAGRADARHDGGGYERELAENRRRSWDPAVIHHNSMEVNNNNNSCSSSLARSENGNLSSVPGWAARGPRVSSSPLLNGATSNNTSFSSAGSAFTPTGPHSQSSGDVTHNAPHPSSGTSSSASSHSVAADPADLRNYSLPNIGDMEIAAITQRHKVAHSNSFTCLRDKKRARNLPSLAVSTEDVEQKRRSIADQFSDKLRKYLNQRRVSLNTGLHTSPPGSCEPGARRPRQGGEYDPVADRDDTMSVTSLEVADILAGAPPPAPSDEEDENYDGDAHSDSTIERDSPAGDGLFAPMKFAEEPSSKHIVALKPGPPPATAVHHNNNNNNKDKPDHLASFVEQSMKSFISKVNTPNITNTPSSAEASPPSQPPRGKGGSIGARRASKQRVSMFTILRTHRVNCVSLLKQRRRDPLHITVHDADLRLANGMSGYNGQSGVSEKINMCTVKSVEHGASVLVVGELRADDVILEVNGHDCTSMCSEEVRKIFQTSDVIKMVVGRPRTMVNSGTDP